MFYAYLGLGSNIGERKKNLERAVDYISEECGIIAVSNIYETEPVGYLNQGWFLNSAVSIETSFSPTGLYNFCKSIESRMDRATSLKNHPRIIDIDILFYENISLKNDVLQIPHKGADKRLFVLVPLNDVAPDLVHPVLNKDISTLLRKNKSRKGIREYLERE